MSDLTLSAVLKIIDEATRPLRAIQQNSDQSADSIKELRRSIDQLNATMQHSGGQHYNQVLAETRQQTSLVRSATQALKAGYNEVAGALDKVIAKTKQWKDSLATSRKAMRDQFKGMLFKGAAGGYGMFQFLKPGIEFGKEMSNVQAVLDLQKNSKEMQLLTADARKWGAASSFSPTEAAQAQYALGSGGFDTNQIHAALGGTLQLAEAGKVELQDAAQIAVGTLNGFGLVAKEIGRVNDVFLQATNATATSVQGLGETMKYVAPVAKAYGATIEQTTAMTGLLGNANILDTQAGTSLRGIMTRLAAPPKEAQKALKSLNITTVDSKGNLREMADIMAEVNTKTKDMGSAKRLDIFKDIAGQEAISAFAVLVDQSVQIDKTTGKTVNNIKQLTKQLEGAKGAAARAAAILKDNLAGDIENMGGAFQDLSIAVSNVMNSDLRALVKRITEIIDRVKNWVEANPELIRTIADIALKLLMIKLALMGTRYIFNLFFGAIFSVIAGITKLTIFIWLLRKAADKLGINLPSRFNLISRGLQLLGRAFVWLSRRAIPLVIGGLRAMAIAMLTNPLTWIIALIAAVALLIWRYWKPIKAFMAGFFDGFAEGIAPLKERFGSLFGEMKQKLSPLRPIWDAIVSVCQIFKGVLGEMFTQFEPTNAQLAAAAANGQSVGYWFGMLIGVIGEVIIRIVEFGASIFQVVGTALGEFAGWIVTLPGKISTAFDQAKTYVFDLGKTVLDFLLAPIRLVIDSVNLLIEGMNKIPNVDLPKIPQIPQYSLPPAPVTGAGNPAAPNPAATSKIPAVKTTPVQPIGVVPAKTTVTNHFGAPSVTIHGATDPAEVGRVVDGKLAKWQRDQEAATRRKFSDQA